MPCPQVTYVNGSTTTATYGSFSIGDEFSTNYTLSVSGYQGDGSSIGDALGTAKISSDLSNGQPFSTKDSENDKCTCVCSDLLGGGWWYSACSWSVLNRDTNNAHWILLNFVTSSRMSITQV